MNEISLGTCLSSLLSGSLPGLGNGDLTIIKELDGARNVCRDCGQPRAPMLGLREQLQGRLGLIQARGLLINCIEDRTVAIRT